MNESGQFDNLVSQKKKLMSVFNAPVMLFDNEFRHNIVKVACGSTWLSPPGSTEPYFDNVMTKFTINKRTDP